MITKDQERRLISAISETQIRLNKELEDGQNLAEIAFLQSHFIKLQGMQKLGIVCLG